MVRLHSTLSKLTALCTLVSRLMLIPTELPLWAYPLLFVTALVAGTIDAIAGGGGLITLPALLSFGLPPSLVFGTNKLQAVFGSGSATWNFIRRDAVDWRECRLGFALTVLGALAGAYTTVRMLDQRLLGLIVPWLLAAIVIYMIFRPQLGETSRHQRLARPVFYTSFGLGLGFYDGFFGPGVGSFWIVAFITLLGQDFLRASAHARVMNFASNLAAFVFFAAAGKVLWLPGLAMGAGQFIGGRLGSHLALNRGARFVRPIFLLMASLLALKLIYASLTRIP